MQVISFLNFSSQSLSFCVMCFDLGIVWKWKPGQISTLLSKNQRSRNKLGECWVWINSIRKIIYKYGEGLISVERKLKKGKLFHFSLRFPILYLLSYYWHKNIKLPRLGGGAGYFSFTRVRLRYFLSFFLIFFSINILNFKGVAKYLW